MALKADTPLYVPLSRSSIQLHSTCFYVLHRCFLPFALLRTLQRSICVRSPPPNCCVFLFAQPTAAAGGLPLNRQQPFPWRYTTFSVAVQTCREVRNEMHKKLKGQDGLGWGCARNYAIQKLFFTATLSPKQIIFLAILKNILKLAKNLSGAENCD